MIDWGQVMLFRDNPFNISHSFSHGNRRLMRAITDYAHDNRVVFELSVVKPKPK